MAVATPVIKSIRSKRLVKETIVVDKYDVAAVLELVRPSLIADGGDVKLIDVSEDGIVTVELTGACRGCPLSELTLANGIERILKERVPGVTRVVPMEDNEYQEE
jgi:Fe-S cluster biogenesis protein NfuA